MRWISLSLVALFCLPGPEVSGEGCTTYSRAMATLQREGDQAMYAYYRNGWESIVLWPAFKGNANDFAICMALPSIPDFRMEKAEFFKDLREYTTVHRNEMERNTESSDGEGKGPREVEVVKVQVSGAYKAVTLKATAAKALMDWLDENKYQYDKGSVQVFEEYAKKEWYFVAVKVIREDLAKEFDGRLRPMALRFETPEPVIWTRFSALNPGGMTMNLYVVADSPIFIGEVPTTYVNGTPVGSRWDGRGVSADFPVHRVFTGELTRELVSKHENFLRILDEDVWMEVGPDKRRAAMELRKDDPAKFAEGTAPRYKGLWLSRFLGHAPQEMLAREIHFVPEKAWDKAGAKGLVEVLRRKAAQPAAREKVIGALKASASHVNVGSLESELTSSETETRKAFAEALGAVAAKESVPGLIAAMEKEEDFFALTSIRDALASITGKTHKLTEAAKYRAWWEKNK